MKTQVVLVKISGWEALYVNGRSAAQRKVFTNDDVKDVLSNHGIQDRLEYDFQSRVVPQEEQSFLEWVDASGGLPDQLGQVPKSKP